MDSMRTIKCVVVGDYDSGKRPLLFTYATGKHPQEYEVMTFDGYSMTVMIGGKPYALSLHASFRPDEYDRLRPLMYPHTDVFLICFSVVNRTSFENIKEKWAPELRYWCPKIPFLVVGTEIEKRTDPETLEKLKVMGKSIVSPDEGRAMAMKVFASEYLECSAMTQKGLKNVFDEAILAVIDDGSQSDAKFSMRSLCIMEEMTGLNIVAALADHYENVMLGAGISLSKSQLKKLKKIESKFEAFKFLIEHWKSRKSKEPRTWRTLLTLLKFVDRDLQKQVAHFIGKLLSATLKLKLMKRISRKADYLSTYQQVIGTQECIEMWFIKVILLGAPRLGKTTACRRLTGEISDIGSSGEEEQPSTGAVESAPSIVIRSLSTSTALVTPTEWVASKDLTDEARMLIQFFHSNALEQKGTFKQTKKDFEKILLDFKSKAAKPLKFSNKVTKLLSFQNLARPLPKSTTQPTATQTASSQTPPTDMLACSSLPDDMQELSRVFCDALSSKYWKDNQCLHKDMAYVKMEDTGGLPELMDMLPFLTFSPALYLLFCKLTDNLKSCFTVSYLSPSVESTIPEVSTYTTEEVILSALASISCFKSHTSQVSSSKPSTSSSPNMSAANFDSSVAYIVGTHKDKVSEEQIDKFDKMLQESLRSTDFFTEGLIKFSSEKRMVLPINNMNGGEDEIKKIQTFLEEGMKQHFKKLRIPAAWLVLSLCLRKREERTASLQSILQLAQELNISSEEAKSALQFLHHHAGVLMYFPELEELKDTVICDTQVVYDSATNLIVNTFRFGKVNVAASEKFQEIGQFSFEDIKEATKGVLGDFIPLRKLMKLLEHLNIIVPILQSEPSTTPTSPKHSEGTYFMPCVLQNATHDEQDRWWSDACSQSSPAPIFIRYECGYVPIGVFPAMIANFASQGSLSMVYKGIKKNRVQFLFGSDFDTVTLISHPKYYAIHLSRRPNAEIPAYEVCLRIRRLVESTLTTVMSHMNYACLVEYRLAFECPSHPGREHLCVVKSGEESPHFMLCLENIKKPQPHEMQNQHLVWFKENSEGDFLSMLHEAALPHTRDFSSCVSSLPACARPHLEMELDWGHDGVDKDLSEIAYHMIKWEEKLAAHLGLTQVDIHDITKENLRQELQRKEALRRWKRYQGPKATYGNLLEIFVKAGHTQCAEAVCQVLREKYPVRPEKKIPT